MASKYDQHNIQYGSIITEQGDLGLGVTPIHEDNNQCEEKNKDK